MNASTEPPESLPKRPSWLRRLVWKPIAWLFGATWAVTKATARFCWWCAQPVRRLMGPLHSWGRWRRNVARLGLRSVPLRRWLVIGLVLLALAPTVSGAVTAVVLYFFSDHGGPVASDILGADVNRWSNPAWQGYATAELQAQGIEFVLFEDGIEIYRSTTDPLSGNDHPGGMRQIDFDSDGPDRMALVYGDDWGPYGEEQEGWAVPAVSVLALIVTFVGLAIFFGRSVVKPLAATSLAAGEVAGGNLDIALPGSRVREVAELNAAFEGMASALAESLAHEARLEQERRLFIGAIAHDLRTPLFSLRGSLEAIRTGVADTEEKKARYLRTAEEKADALDRLISDLFDFTRLEVLDQSPNREPVAFGPLVRGCVEAMQPLAEQKGLTLTVDDRSGESIVLGDVPLLTRAIDNLIDNAIRFTPAGGEARVEVLRDRKTLVMAVSDTGPGIPPEDLERLFDPLFRGESSRNRRTGGAGLGLTIARNVFTAHGGDLEAHNGPDGGARFIATIPVG
jgi:signal transduction histidine kinase